MKNVYTGHAEQICMSTDNTWNAWKVEYLGELETKLEIFLGG
jgi:hypothetical protein